MYQGYPLNKTIILPLATEHNLVARDANGEILWLPTWSNVWRKLDGVFEVKAPIEQVWEVGGGVLWVFQSNYDMVDPTKKPIPAEIWKVIGEMLGYKKPPRWYMDMDYGLYSDELVDTPPSAPPTE
ncbi:hypothetical protein JAAARDRAFT_202063 [Jaapia argillacea MUCL 33604]|uniref:Uncharacterized protein n=1 Tax=Jaapia argillacea MUCL 33604 TaxID=933084 RepID=A0A067QCI4_9AGAM|nr:hypothetical protein JAAARDRAFT_202063 [Jaapia argillacea MUCL 33604]